MEAAFMSFFEEMESRIPKGKVRTRFAPSPTGYMHVGNLRTGRSRVADHGIQHLGRCDNDLTCSAALLIIIF